MYPAPPVTKTAMPLFFFKVIPFFSPETAGCVQVMHAGRTTAKTLLPSLTHWPHFLVDTLHRFLSHGYDVLAKREVPVEVAQQRHQCEGGVVLPNHPSANGKPHRKAATLNQLSKAGCMRSEKGSLRSEEHTSELQSRQ